MYFEDYVTIDPQNSLAYCNDGYALSFEEGNQHYNSSLKIKEDIDEVWVHKKNSLPNQIKLKEVMECYDESIELQESSPAYDLNSIIPYRQNSLKDAERISPRSTLEIDSIHKNILKDMNENRDILQK